MRRWGTGLAAADDQELRATGKAILLLIEEIEALHVDVWNAKTVPAEEDGAEPKARPNNFMRRWFVARSGN